jgi:hypothetical protein
MHLHTPALDQHPVLRRHQQIAPVAKRARRDLDRGHRAARRNRPPPGPEHGLRTVLERAHQVAGPDRPDRQGAGIGLDQRSGGIAGKDRRIGGKLSKESCSLRGGLIPGPYRSVPGVIPVTSRTIFAGRGVGCPKWCRASTLAGRGEFLARIALKI